MILRNNPSKREGYASWEPRICGALAPSRHSVEGAVKIGNRHASRCHVRYRARARLRDCLREVLQGRCEWPIRAMSGPDVEGCTRRRSALHAVERFAAPLSQGEDLRQRLHRPGQDLPQVVTWTEPAEFPQTPGRCPTSALGSALQCRLADPLAAGLRRRWGVTGDVRPRVPRPIDFANADRAAE